MPSYPSLMVRMFVERDTWDLACSIDKVRVRRKRKAVIEIIGRGLVVALYLT